MHGMYIYTYGTIMVVHCMCKSNYDTCMEMTRFVLMIFLMMMVAFESVCLIFLQLVSHAAMCRYIIM